MKGINRSGRGFGKTREPSKCWAAVRDKAGLGEWLRASLIKNLVKNLPAMQETPSSIPGLGRSPGEGIGYPLQYSWASLVAHLIKNPPAMWETWLRSLDWEDPLEKGTDTHSSILAWRIPKTV